MKKNKSTTKIELTKELEIIKEKYTNHLNEMISKHSKVLQTRFDLRYPKDYDTIETSSHISSFLDNLTKDLKRNIPLPKPGMKRGQKLSPQVHDPDPRIMWVRENHGKSENPHFHCLALVNGNAKKSGEDIQKRADRQWGNIVNPDSDEGLVDFCYRSGPHSIMIKRTAEDFDVKVEQAKRQASYLSKPKGKEKPEKGAWKVGGTRLKKNK